LLLQTGGRKRGAGGRKLGTAMRNLYDALAANQIGNSPFSASYHDYITGTQQAPSDALSPTNSTNQATTSSPIQLPLAMEQNSIARPIRCKGTCEIV